MGARESANWRNASFPLDLRIELPVESTAAGGDGGKAEAIASGDCFCRRLHDGSPPAASPMRATDDVDVIVEVRVLRRICALLEAPSQPGLF